MTNQTTPKNWQELTAELIAKMGQAKACEIIANAMIIQAKAEKEIEPQHALNMCFYRLRKMSAGGKHALAPAKTKDGKSAKVTRYTDELITRQSFGLVEVRQYQEPTATARTVARIEAINNAGTARTVDNKTTYEASPEQIALALERLDSDHATERRKAIIKQEAEAVIKHDIFISNEEQKTEAREKLFNLISSLPNTAYKNIMLLLQSATLPSSQSDIFTKAKKTLAYYMPTITTADFYEGYHRLTA